MVHSLNLQFKKTICAASIALALTSCTTFDAGKKDFKVTPLWAQDTLSSPNHKFRKVNRMTPVIYKNSVVIGNSYDGLVSYNLDTKNTNWKAPIDLGVEASGAMVRDTLFIGSNNGKIYSIDLIDGEINWSFDTKSEAVSEPLLDEGVLYFITASQSVYALDAVSGKQQWIYSRQDTSGGMTIRGGSKPAISEGILYVGFSDGAVVAISAKTGTEQWEITLNRNTKFKDIDSSPVIVGDLVYINSYDDKLYCLSKAKGEILWSSPYGGASTPLVVGETLFTTSSKGDFVALQKQDAKLLWQKSTKNGVFIDPLDFGDLVVTGESQGKLLFINKLNGETLGSFEPGRGVFSKPVVHRDKLYFISGEGNIYGIEAKYESKSSIYYLK